MIRNTLAALALIFPLAANAWEVDDLNDHIEQTNFIVGDHCSATLVSVEYRLLLTNHHCITGYLQPMPEEYVDSNGVIQQRMIENRADVPVSQKTYKDHRVVSTSSYTATIMDYDEKVDLAILQLRVEDLPRHREAKLGDVVTRGETVYAVGNPLGLDASVTKGIVSNVNRLIRVSREQIPFYQIDAGIAGGSSGGSLYNGMGLLIGVPAAVARGTAVGLAIPVSHIKDFLAKNCFSSLWDDTAVGYDLCKAEQKTE